MKLSPLQLVQSHFTAFSIVSRDIDQEVVAANLDPYPPVSPDQIETRVQLGLPEGEDDPRQFLVKVGISTAKELPEDFPYKFAVQIEGIFDIEDDGDREDRERLVVINGGSMLVGIIREQLLSLTLRHKHGPLQLPALDFRALRPEKKLSATPEPKEKSKRIRRKKTTE